MKLFSHLLLDVPPIPEVLKKIEKKETPLALFGLSAVHRGLFCAALREKFPKRPVLILVSEEREGRRLTEDLCTMCGEGTAAFFPVRDYVFSGMEGASREYESERLGILTRLIKSDLPVVIACADGLCQLTLPKEVLQSHLLTLKEGDEISLQKLSALLSENGYERREQVDGVCQFSVRGGILDLFSPADKEPVRLEFFGDEIDSISHFSLETQRRTQRLKGLELSPARELTFPAEILEDAISSSLEKAVKKGNEELKDTLKKQLAMLSSGVSLPARDAYYHAAFKTPATLLDYLENPLILVSDLQAVHDRAAGYAFQLNEDIKGLLEQGRMAGCGKDFSLSVGALLEALGAADTLLLDTFAKGHTLLPVKSSFTLHLPTASPWSGLLSAIKEDLLDYVSRKYAVLIAMRSEKSGRALVSDLEKEGIRATFSRNPSSVLLGSITVLPAPLSAGFEIPSSRTLFITQGQDLSSPKSGLRRPKPKGQRYDSLADLVEGDYVVHATHGIGIFSGIHKIETGGIAKDYIKIRYAESGVLYVPVSQLDLVARYLGAKDGSAVKLNKLGGGEWEKTKSRVKTAVKQMAKELIELYSARLKSKGFAFSEDDNFTREFDDRFEYEETDDQIRSISEIKKDMQRPVPMDRLLCGDVGFGKTEVALRAAFKCMYEGKQCVLLCPTTILAWQHYQTALRRFEGYPFRIEILSRFRTPKQQKAILADLKKGVVDLVIGTHRLVQKDVDCKDLGLVIIDEEQRFGVAHKEKFKQMFKEVDVLTLSATPIPRTLNMAMSGIRDMSVIEQPPMDRQPVQTYVLEYDPIPIKEAIRKELRRGGQVFYLHNKVEDILSCAAKVSEMVPEARVDIGHGKMGEEELSKVWQRLMDHETDVLVCTTIIETGVDVSNANTLIVENADHLGLSQLYQLRGRVGRSPRRAYAYFTFARGKVLTEVATKRLEAIREFTNFGSGFRIAMRDLQIRGAGSVLGGNQHGHMEQVGYDMYLRLLEQAVAEEKGIKPPRPEVECVVDLQINAHMPESYITSYSQRIEVYKKIAAVRTEEDRSDLIDELIDRYGDPPTSVLGLMQVSLLRNKATNLGIYEIKQQGVSLLFYYKGLEMKVLSHLAGAFKGRVMVNASQKPYVSVKLNKGESPVTLIDMVLSKMSETGPSVDTK
ncbi:MAG: transcription-repair coupling factor [Oscillospiraceae bacterium]|nr:transcription-repair coupling factor [Oscillospiraceae bacterium]